MNTESLMIGAGGGLVGLLLGILLTQGSDLEEIEARMIKQIDERAAEQSEAVATQFASLSEQVSGLETAMAENATAGAGMGEAVTAQIDGAVSTLSGQLDTVSETVTSSINESIAAASAAQSEQLSSALDGHLSEIVTAVDQVTAATAPAPETVAETPEAPAEPEIEGVRPGQTEVLMNGKARVFVSSINVDEKSARVAVNGLSLQRLGGFEDVTFELDDKNCMLLLDDIVQGHVQMSVTCGE